MPPKIQAINQYWDENLRFLAAPVSISSVSLHRLIGAESASSFLPSFGFFKLTECTAPCTWKRKEQELVGGNHYLKEVRAATIM